MSDLTQVSSAMGQLAAASDVHAWTTPLHIPQHRDDILACLARGDASYPARFDYAPFDTEALLRACDVVVRLAGAVAHPELRDAVVRTATDARRRAEAARSGDDATWSHVCRDIDGLPTTSVLETASEILRESAPPAAAASSPLPTARLVSAIEAALDNYDLPDWKVKIESSMAAGMSVVGGERCIRVREGLEVTPRQMARLVVHEIGGHVLRWENSWAQDFALAGHPLLDSIPTEEGLAVVLEEQLGVADVSQLRVYALRVLAVDWAQSMGVVPLVRRLGDLVPEVTAIEVAIRVKRGLKDPNNPGGMTKDHGYLSGLLQLRDLDAADLVALRTTKWPLRLLPVIWSLGADGQLDAGLSRTASLDRLGVDPSWLA